MLVLRFKNKSYLYSKYLRRKHKKKLKNTYNSHKAHEMNQLRV